MTILSQRDSRWGNLKLGNGSTTISSYGCTITCVAMLAGLTPTEVNERLKRVEGFLVDKIIWGKIKEAIPWLDFEWRGYSYDNEKVKKAISDYGGCLIEVDFDGKISSPNDKHWVLYVGNQRMYDPWTGVEKVTTYYPLTLGYSIIKVGPRPGEEIPPGQPTVITDQTKIDLGPKIGTLEVQAVRSTILDLKTAIEGFRRDVGGLEVQVEALKKNQITISDKLNCPNSYDEIIKEIDKLITLEDQTNDLSQSEWSILEFLRKIFGRGGEKNGKT